MNPHEPVNDLNALSQGNMTPDSPSMLNYRRQQLLAQHPAPYLPRASVGNGSFEPGTQGGRGVVAATAKYRAANIVAAAARTERDYHLAKLNFETKIAEDAERRALCDLSKVMQTRPANNEMDVTKAMITLGADRKNVYPGMLTPGYGRLGDVASLRESGLSMLPPNSAVLSRGYPSHFPPAHYLPDVIRNGKRPGDFPEGEYTKKMKQAMLGSDSSSPSMDTQSNKKGKRPADMPRRPLSAYNFFFSEERERVLASLPDPNDKDGSKNKESTEEKDKGETKEGETKEGETKEGETKEGETKEGETKEGETKEGETKDEDKSADKSETSPKDAQGESNGAPKNPKSNQERLLALRLVREHTRRPHRKTHGKIGFKALAKLIGERWRALTLDQKEPYKELAKTDLSRYKEQMEEYNRKTKWAFLQEQGHQPPASK